MIQIEEQLNIFDLLEQPKEEVVYKPFTYASAFAGIGGMTLGLKPLGGVGVAAWEYDPTEKRTQYAQEAHRLLHPEIPLYGDICEAVPKNLPNFDVFCFTPPCQAFSVAGKRGGFEDTRGTLTFEALHIANVKRPKILFMENVKGLVNHDKGNTMSTILHAINEIGYTVDFTVLNSKYFDVAQNRERVYLIAIRDDLITPEPWNDVKGSTMLPKAKRRYQEEGAKTFNFDWPEQTKVRTRLRDFLEDNVDKKCYLSGDKTAALVAQLESTPVIPSILDTRQKSADTKSGKSAVRVSNDVCPTISATEAKDVKKVIELDAAKIIELGKINPHRHSSLMNTVHSVNGISSTSDTMNGGNREPKIAEEVRPCLTPFREEKRQNGPRFKENGAEAHTITTIDRHGVAIGEYPRYRIRKLTPTECLKLQSVPQWAIDALSTEFSDSRLYKFAGNGLTTSVISAIGKKIIQYL